VSSAAGAVEKEKIQSKTKPSITSSVVIGDGMVIAQGVREDGQRPPSQQQAQLAGRVAIITTNLNSTCFVFELLQFFNAPLAHGHDAPLGSLLHK